MSNIFLIHLTTPIDDYSSVQLYNLSPQQFEQFNKLVELERQRKDEQTEQLWSDISEGDVTYKDNPTKDCSHTITLTSVYHWGDTPTEHRFGQLRPI